MVSIYWLNPVFCMSVNINQGCGRVDIDLGLLKPSSLHLHVSRVHRAALLYEKERLSVSPISQCGLSRK